MVKAVIWNFAGVVYTDPKYGGKPTTLLADNDLRDPREALERFYREAGQPGPLSVVTADELRYAESWWAANRNQGRPIENRGDLGRFLTDCRHHVPSDRKTGNVFPKESSTQTVYTKNAVLEGMSMRQIYEIMFRASLTEGFDVVVGGFGEDGARQAVFSEIPKPVIDSINDGLGEDQLHVEAILPIVVDNRIGREEEYDTEAHFAEENVTLTGRMLRFNANARIGLYLEERGLTPADIAIIGDSIKNKDRMAEVAKAGGVAVGFGTDMQKYRAEFLAAGIPVVRADIGLDLHPFLEIVRDPTRVREFCDVPGNCI